MKSCPKCATEYFDDMLEFCLEDGAKLSPVLKSEDDAPTITKQSPINPFTEKTFNLPYSNAPKTVEINKPNDIPTTALNPKSETAPAFAQVKILEILPVIFALAHNWWQWLYVGNQYISSIPSFLISANFLLWLLLLTAGAAVSIFSVKRSQNKNFAIVSLVILSVNLILFLVPKH